MSIHKEVQKLAENHLLSKHERIVQGTLIALNKESITIGDKLPSVIKMAKALGYSNRTVAIAYEKLKDRGVIESKSTKGYFVSNTDINITLKLGLVLYDFQSFQEDFYNLLREELGEKYHVDVFFHHNDINLFKTISQNILGKYGFYMMAPIQKKGFMTMLDVFPESKTLLIDRWPTEESTKKFPLIIQEFEQTIIKELTKLKEQIKKYKRIILFFNHNLSYPEGILRGFNTFVNNHKIEHEIRSNYIEGSLEQDNLYFFIGDTPLWHFLRDVKKQEYILGKDLGVIAHNDSIEKEIILGGISVFSTNFRLMALKASAHVKNTKIYTHEIIPSRLIFRDSF